jgi:hypothetical protein
MNNSNQQTIQAYEDHIQDYINGTVRDTGDGSVKDWIDEFLTDLPKTARILEFGSAFGRDAEYIQKQGYKVECTDATQAFVDLLNKKGFSARHLNSIFAKIPEPKILKGLKTEHDYRLRPEVMAEVNDTIAEFLEKHKM